jgi:hypothetical protein
MAAPLWSPATSYQATAAVCRYTAHGDRRQGAGSTPPLQGDVRGQPPADRQRHLMRPPQGRFPISAAQTWRDLG